MDYYFISKYMPLYIRATGLTLKIATIAIFFSLIVGFVCSLTTYFKIPLIRPIVTAYIELSRNTPLLVQLFFLYFGLPKLGIMLSSEACAVIGMVFLGGSYMATAFQSGFDAIDKIQYEVALSIGLTKWQAMRHVILPQAVATAVPAFSANIIFLIKETSVLSVVALADLMYIAKELIGLYYKTEEALFMLVIFYLIILLPISIGTSYLERRLKYAGFGDLDSIRR